MAQTATFRRTGGPDAQFDFQRYDVYRVALEFQALVPQLVRRRGSLAYGTSSIERAPRSC